MTGKSGGTISEKFVSSRDHQPCKKTASSHVLLSCTTVSVTPEEVERPVRTVAADYSPFNSKGFVSLPRSNTQDEVAILRDSGAFDSFVLRSILPFSADTDTGEDVLVCGMGQFHLCSCSQRALEV